MVAIPMPRSFMASALLSMGGVSMGYIYAGIVGVVVGLVIGKFLFTTRHNLDTQRCSWD